MTVEMREVRQPNASWAGKSCQYAVKSGKLKLWNDCGKVAAGELDGNFLCSEHLNAVFYAVDTIGR